MRAAILAAAAMACGLATGAEAAVFDLTGQTYNAVAQSIGTTAQFDLVISDAAVARGSFNLVEAGGNGGSPTISGNVADFVSASIGETVTPTSDLFSTVRMALTFAGGVASGSILFDGEFAALQLTGSNGTFTGPFGSGDRGSDCQSSGPNACVVTGQLTETSASPVPEPVSMTLLGAGLLGLAGVRRFSR